MTVKHSAFAERVFEFAFNSEYAHKNRAILAACPSLPSQNEEKFLGYDVEMKIKERGGAVSSLFLQHKIVRYVDKRSGSNAHFYAAAGGPYFAFGIDVDQYNLIHRVRTKKLEAIYYCAPRFTTRSEIEGHYFGQSVVDESIWIDIRAAGAITDSDSHTMIFNKDMSKVCRFSDEPISAASVDPKLGIERARRVEKFDLEEVRATYDFFFEELKAWWPDRRQARRKSEVGEDSIKRMPTALPTRTEFNGITPGIKALQELLGDYYGVSWLIGVKE